MTGVFHQRSADELCPACRKETGVRDWTCPHCGRVLDTYLFGTITPKSVSGLEKDAFGAGYEACRNRWQVTGSVDLGEYCPSPGYETFYRAGWQHAANELEAKEDRKRGRRRGLQLAGTGALFTLIAGAALASGPMAAWNLILLGAGLLNLMLGIFALITGTSDACPPDLPAQSSRAIETRPPAPLPTDEVPAAIAPRVAVSVTWALVALNVLVFIAMLVRGVNALSPTSGALIAWGADFGPRTTAGEWWRLITSMFLHIGVIHLAFNMFALVQVGPFLERLFGRAAFTTVYLIAGISGGLASLAWDPYRVSAGASGAIFGLYGALFGFLAVQRRRIPPPVVSALLSGALPFVGYNLVYGLTTPNIDMSAHLGGLAGGFVAAAALVALGSRPALRSGTLRSALVAGAAAVAIVVVAGALPRAADMGVQLQELSSLESKTLARYNSAVQRLRKGEIAGPQFATIVETEVLPDWTAGKDALSRLRGLPPRQAAVTESLVRYMELRRDGWHAAATGVREKRLDKMKYAVEQQTKADVEIQTILRGLKKP